MMLTAKDSENDKIIGLDAGADDYMTKPFSVLELCARVRALLRRGGAAPAPKKGGVLKSGGLKLDLAVREATRDGALLELTYKEFELLRELMENAPGADVHPPSGHGDDAGGFAASGVGRCVHRRNAHAGHAHRHAAP